MNTFEASRLSEGNKIFPAKIIIETFGVTLKIPGFLGGKEKTLSYQDISSVTIDTPMVGYSKITFKTIGFDLIIATGFSKADAQQIKQIVQHGIMSVTRVAASQGGIYSNTPQVIIQDSAEQMRVEAEKDAQIRKEVAESDDRFLDGVKKLFLFKTNNSAKEHHLELEGIETDIKIALSKGDKETASKLIRELKHDSNLFVPKTNISYRQYWTNKREECLERL